MSVERRPDWRVTDSDRDRYPDCPQCGAIAVEEYERMPCCQICGWAAYYARDWNPDRTYWHY